MGFKPFLAACHIFTICIVVCLCNVVANKVLSLVKCIVDDALAHAVPGVQ